MAGKNERQRRQARERHRRQQEQRLVRQRQVRKRWAIGTLAVLVAAGVGTLLLIFLPGGSAKKASASASKSPSASPTATATAVAEPAHHCSYTSATPVAKKVSFPPATPDYTDSYQATINTNQGKITFNLLNNKATCTVNSFVHLAEAGYFNNTQCHRLLTSGIYVLQCGDPYATATAKLNCSTTSKIGTGTPGYDFASENLKGAKYPAGTVAMANEGSASNKRQPVLHRVQGQHIRANGFIYTVRHGVLRARISSRMWLRMDTRVSMHSLAAAFPRRRSSLTV